MPTGLPNSGRDHARWANAASVSIPSWVAIRQDEFQSLKYADEASRIELVLRAAAMNAELEGAAPLAAAVFMADGTLVSLGVDAPGIGGHEMTNALILASNVLETRQFRGSRTWDLYSLAPPCSVCLGNIYCERPRAFVCAVNHDDLLSALDLPDTLMPGPEWVALLEQRGITVKEATCRQRGVQTLRLAKTT
jgi:tRNA(Arg) A34 adenosine deaminase TadA